MTCLCFLEIKHLLVGTFTSIFSQSVGFFCFVYSFLCCAQAYKFNYVPLVYFCLCFHYSRRYIQKNITAIYVKGCSACIFFLYEFYSIQTYISVFKLFYFYIQYQRIFSFHTWTCSCPVSLVSLIEEMVFSALSILASFVID